MKFNEPTDFMGFRCPAHLATYIRKRAYDERLSVSRVLRDLIVQGIAEEELAKTAQ
jgi:predicted PP-loop superfamily ATPase